VPSEQGNKKKKCSGWILIYTRIATRVPPHQKCPKQTTRHTSRSPSRAPLSRSQGNSSFRGHHHPENSHFPEHFSEHHSAVPDATPPARARHLHQPISLIFTFNSASRTPLIHGVGYATRSSQILNIATALTPAWTVTDGSRNHSQ